MAEKDERNASRGQVIRLTERCKAAGCAGKLGPADLGAMLAGFEVTTDPNLLVGISTGDDAGVYRINDDLAIVSTVDFFTPVVDDPFTYGQIAAANAMSDVYAMGGRPITALNVVCWPQSGLPREMLNEILRGGSQKAKEGGVLVVGGHSVGDEEVKYGMAITGVIDPKRVIRNVGAKVGDALVLTKPLGTGTLLTAFKRDRLAREHYDSAVATMLQLNARAAEVMLKYQVHAATDITGFGLTGHASKMADGSGVTIVFEESDLPLLPGAIECCRDGFIPGGATRNRDFYGPRVKTSEEVSDEMSAMAFDPQTSGGLLIAVPADDATSMVAELHRAGVSEACVVGRVTDPSGFAIELV
jgi:selenide,water dikinase